jgi:ABC-type multidrug transport system fused ATPase/permease subunit
VLEAVNLAVFFPMLDHLVGAAPGGGHAQRILMQWVDRLIHVIPIHDQFIAAGMMFLGLTVLKGVLSLWHEYLVADASGEILERYRNELVESYRNASLAFLDQQRTGALIYNLSMPPIMLSKLLYTLPRTMIDFLRFFFVLVLLFYMEPVVTLEFIVAGVILYFVVSRPLSRYTYRLSNARRVAEQQMSAVSTEWLHGLRPIRTADADAYWVDMFTLKNSISRHAYVQTSFLLASPRHVLELIAFSSLFIGMMLSYWQNPGEFASHVATIGFFAMGLVRVLPSFSTLARAPLDIKTMLPDVENLYEILNNLPVKDIEGDTEFVGLQQAIYLNNVSVKHEGRPEALSNISLVIPKAHVVAFVGSSGSGKTTMLNVLIGAQAVSAGHVTYDDCELRNLNKSGLLSRIGYVGQDVLLFHGTIFQNIAYFKDDVSLESVKSAAAIAEISKFIESLPDGYDSMVGESGVNFSGGQAQRLAIARAIVNNPDILILDEATSALDATSEKMVVDALQHASKNRTVVMVTHRLATVKWADMIHVLNNGELIESGSWNDLLADKSNRFYQMCREQELLSDV